MTDKLKGIDLTERLIRAGIVNGMAENAEIAELEDDRVIIKVDLYLTFQQVRKLGKDVYQAAVESTYGELDNG